MKDVVLLEMAAVWEREAKNPEAENAAPDAELGNARRRGWREAKAECADKLRALVSLLGESDAKG